MSTRRNIGLGITTALESFLNKMPDVIKAKTEHDEWAANEAAKKRFQELGGLADQEYQSMLQQQQSPSAVAQIAQPDATQAAGTMAAQAVEGQGMTSPQAKGEPIVEESIVYPERKSDLRSWKKGTPTSVMLANKNRYAQHPGIPDKPMVVSRVVGRLPVNTPQDQMIVEFATKNMGGDSISARALVMTESGGLVNAESPTGVKGLFQVTRDTGKEYIPDYDPTKPEHSAEAGTKHFGRLLQKYQDPVKAYAAYNAGERDLDKALKMGGDWKNNFNKVLLDSGRADKAEEVKKAVTNFEKNRNKLTSLTGKPTTQSTATAPAARTATASVAEKKKSTSLTDFEEIYERGASVMDSVIGKIEKEMPKEERGKFTQRLDYLMKNLTADEQVRLKDNLEMLSGMSEKEKQEIQNKFTRANAKADRELKVAETKVNLLATGYKTEEATTRAFAKATAAQKQSMLKAKLSGYQKEMDQLLKVKQLASKGKKGEMAAVKELNPEFFTKNVTPGVLWDDEETVYNFAYELGLRKKIEETQKEMSIYEGVDIENEATLPTTGGAETDNFSQFYKPGSKGK